MLTLVALIAVGHFFIPQAVSERAQSVWVSIFASYLVAVAAATLCVFLLFSARPPMIAGLPYTIIGLVFLVPIGIWRGRKNRSKKS